MDVFGRMGSGAAFQLGPRAGYHFFLSCASPAGIFGIVLA